MHTHICLAVWVSVCTLTTRKASVFILADKKKSEIEKHRMRSV
jgi:hypothetical protein